MARRVDIQYIQYYTDGSAAKKIEHTAPRKRKKPIIPPAKQTQYVLHIDLLAIVGIVMAAVLLIMMLIGVMQLRAAQEETRLYAQYVAQLEQNNELLQAEYADGYDLEQIRQQALLLGLVPIESVEHIDIDVSVPQNVEEPTLWERICEFFRNW